MTKENLKYFIDNRNPILNEIEQRLETAGQSDVLEEITSENITELYDVCDQYCSDILDKYNLNFDAFKTIVAIFGDRAFKEQILGKDEANQLLKDIVDIYGDEAYELLGCNNFDFEMSEIDGVLSGESNENYRNFYKKVLDSKCKQAYTLDELNDILLSTKPEFVNEELIEEFVKNPNKTISESEIKDFINDAPSQIINGNTIKVLVNRVDNIQDKSLLEQIPQELYDEKFSMNILEKSKFNTDVFNLIPEKYKTKEIWEQAVSNNSNIIESLPEKKTDAKMSDQEYAKWSEKLVLEVISNNPSLFSNLKDSQKTISVCNETAKLLTNDKINGFIESVPQESRSMELYEILLEKSENIIREIPDESFIKGVSQEDYQNWMDNILTKKISQTHDIKELLDKIPREKRTEKVWNALFDKCIEENVSTKRLGLQFVSIQNRTPNMCERALKNLGLEQISYVPTVDRKIDTISNKEEKEEYKKWLDGFSEEEKNSYRKWYDGIVMKSIKENNAPNIFTDKLEEHFGLVKIPPEALSFNVINAYLKERGPEGIKNIPIPSELTKYNNQYEDIVISAISMLPDLDYTGDKKNIFKDFDILDNIPEEYRTDRVVLDAIKKDPKYLNYADINKENFGELLQTAYKSKLESMGRSSLSDEEIGLIQRFAKNNSDLFSTLNVEILNPKIVSSIREDSIEKITRYSGLQSKILNISKSDISLTTFGFALENLKKDDLFIEPLVEQLSDSINIIYNQKYIVHNDEFHNHQTHDYPNRFLLYATKRIKDTSRPMTDEEKTIISYLALHPEEAKRINNYDDILNYVANKNANLDRTINSNDVTLIGAKDAYLQRIVGINYETAIDLVNRYGNDPENLLAKYSGKELGSYKEMSEKESLEIIVKLKSIIGENDLDAIKQAYQQAISREDKTKSYERYMQGTLVYNTLRRSYGRDITEALDEHDKENNVETVEHTEDGQEYLVRKINGPFNRMVSLMDAYVKSEAEGDMYEKWNTSKMAENHALCYSYINQDNPGTAKIKDNHGNVKDGIVISISGFVPEAVTAVAPYDLSSNSRTITTTTLRPQKFYTSNDLPNQTRGRYSELDIEIQDVSGNTNEYKKIQPTSIICFEEVDENSIKAAIDLSKKLGRTVPIELIDRRELANQTKTEIESLLEQYKKGEILQPELVGQIITKFNNVRNAHLSSGLSDELLGENPEKENLQAIFNKSHLNEMLSECIDVTKQRIQDGEVEEGLSTIEQIKGYIKTEREKNALMPTMREKQIMAGIDLDIDYSLDEIQREYGKLEISNDSINESLEIVETTEELSSPTFEILYRNTNFMPEQLSFTEFQDSIDIPKVQETIQDVHEKGYYSENKTYSEEHIARVAMYSNAIANLEGADDKTKKLLGEAVKYYSSGRMLDIANEPYQEYSAKIAGKELYEKESSGEYSKEDVGIVQAAIELQDMQYESNKTHEQEVERKEKITELCGKYGLEATEGEQIDKIATYIEDSVNLDNARFVTNIGTKQKEQFQYYGLKTDTAKKLVEASYCIQDELAQEHLKDLSNVASIDFDSNSEKSNIMEEFFREDGLETVYRLKKEVTASPIVQEVYFRHKYSEIDDPVKIGRDLEKNRNKEQEIAGKDSSEVTTAKENLTFTEQEIGKATINTPTIDKDNAKNREKQDEKEIQQTKDVQSQLE